jgi:hypothetical protein
MQVYDTDNWHVSAYIANQQMNNCPHEARDMLTQYQIYLSQEEDRSISWVASCRGSDGVPQEISS